MLCDDAMEELCRTAAFDDVSLVYDTLRLCIPAETLIVVVELKVA